MDESLVLGGVFAVDGYGLIMLCFGLGRRLMINKNDEGWSRSMIMELMVDGSPLSLFLLVRFSLTTCHFCSVFSFLTVLFSSHCVFLFFFFVLSTDFTHVFALVEFPFLKNFTVFM